MADENKDKNPPAAVPAKADKRDLTKELDPLTYPAAVEHFGKENALSVMHKVAEIGGHGMFEDAYFLSPLFGGLSMPDPEMIIKPDFKLIDSLPNATFYRQEATDIYEQNKERAVKDRATINQLFLDSKKD